MSQKDLSIDDVKTEQGQGQVKKYRRQMIRGMIWAIAGTAIIFITYNAASIPDGVYYLCWGAALFGLIDFVVGSIGWLTHQG